MFTDIAVETFATDRLPLVDAVEAGAAVADFSAALAAANAALASLDGTSAASRLYAFEFDGTNGYLFIDTDSDGDADQVVILTGVTDAGISAGDIIA